MHEDELHEAGEGAVEDEELDEEVEDEDLADFKDDQLEEDEMI